LSTGEAFHAAGEVAGALNQNLQQRHSQTGPLGDGRLDFRAAPGHQPRVFHGDGLVRPRRRVQKRRFAE